MHKECGVVIGNLSNISDSVCSVFSGNKVMKSRVESIAAEMTSWNSLTNTVTCQDMISA